VSGEDGVSRPCEGKKLIYTVTLFVLRHVTRTVRAPKRQIETFNGMEVKTRLSGRTDRPK